MEEYINYKYESDIINIINKCLKLININNSLKQRRIEFDAMFDYEHNLLFLDENNNYTDEINNAIVRWEKYDGNVILKYRPYRRVKFTIRNFYINKIKNILNENIMKEENTTYVITENLPDASEGTIVKWDNESQLYYYINEKINTPVYLAKEQVENNYNIFIRQKEYPEYYGYYYPVLSRKDVLNLYNEYFKHNREKNKHKFETQLRELTKFKAEEILNNQKNEFSNLKNKDIDISDAIQILIKHLKEDNEYRQGWIANIAMAMYDVFNENEWDDGKKNSSLHEQCNKGAENFINLLIKN